jgi:hydrogenase expression/formation protein HypE
MPNEDAPTGGCPLPLSAYSEILMAHGGGGRLMQQLIAGVFLPAFGPAHTGPPHDGAVLDLSATRVAFTTDTYVVQPLFFPGGDIGTLAVNGTVNDLAMCGARPVCLSAGFVIEEGLPIETLQRVVDSMRRAAEAARVGIVTGDTKVVDRGKGDGLFINTAGIGVCGHGAEIGPRSVAPGDAILLNGDIGRHGTAIMAAREGLAFESEIESDCAPLAETVLALLDAGIVPHCLRDATRGGLASVLVEIAQAGGVGIRIREEAIPVREDVQGACELLGFDPLHVANEGRMAVFVPPQQSDAALSAMRSTPQGADAVCIGFVEAGPRGLVTLTTRLGTSRIVDMLSGEQLPRIC